MRSFLHESRIKYVVWLLILLQLALTSSLVVMRLYGYRASFDSAVFDQVLWAIGQTGVPLTTTAPPFTELNWLGWHFSPILYALAPLRMLLPYAETMTLLQCLCFALAGLPLFHCIVRMGLSSATALLLMGVFLFNPILISAAIWDFHEISLACLWVACTFWAWAAYRRAWFLFFLLLMLLTKEHYGLFAACMGILWLHRYPQEKRFGIAVVGAGVLCLIVVLLLIMPWLNGGDHPMLQPPVQSEGVDTTGRYGWLGKPFPLMFATALDIAFNNDVGKIPGILYVFQLLMGWVFLPVFAPLLMLPAIADLAANLLSTNPLPRYVASYHSATILPVLTVAAAGGLLRMQAKGRKWRGIDVTLLLFCTLMMFTMSNPYKVWEMPPVKYSVNMRDVSAIREIVKDKPVTVQSNVGLFFAGRKVVFPFPEKIEQTKYMVFSLYHPFQKIEYNPFFAIYALSPKEHYERLQELLEDCRVLYWNNYWLVLERGEGGLPVKQEVLDRIHYILSRR